MLAMNASTTVKKGCESCLFWDGKQTSYLGMCCHPQNYPSRVTFDYTCPLYSAQPAVWSMQPMIDDAISASE
jgi:hypothetical protein